MQGELVKQLSSALAKLMRQYASHRLSSQLIHETLSFSESILSAMKEHPDIMVGQIILTEEKFPYSLNLAFKTTLCAALLCIRNRVNDSCSQQVVSAAITLNCFNRQATESLASGGSGALSHTPHQPLLNALEKARMDVWRNGLTLSRQLNNLAKDASLNAEIASCTSAKETCLLALAFAISYRQTPRSEAKLKNYAQMLQSVCALVPSAAINMLSPLVEYPGLLPQGSTIKLLNGRLMAVLAIQSSHLIVRQINKSADDTNVFDRITPHQISAISAPKPGRAIAKVNAWWDQSYLEMVSELKDIGKPAISTFRLDKPPSTLIDIQRLLLAPDVDIAKMADIIQRDDSLSSHLKQMATISSRQKIKIEDVKHSLMMHGYERTNSLLVQQALLLRLNQHYFPLQDQFIQFTRLRCHLASCLMALADKGLTEKAYTLACFASAGLFTIPALKGHRTWMVRQGRWFDVNYLVKESEKRLLQQHAIKLAEAWQQQPAMIMALRNQDMMPATLPKHKIAAKLTTCLGLSLLMARQCYFDEHEKCHDSERYIKQACQLLNLNPQQIDQIRMESPAFCHISCSV